MEISRIPFEGYAEAYIHKFTTPWGKKVEEIVLGKPYEDPKDKPSHYEYDRTCHRHIGTVRVSVTSDDPNIEQRIISCATNTSTLSEQDKELLLSDLCAKVPYNVV